MIAPVSTAGSSPITVVLADAHAGMRRSLRRLLDAEVDIEVLAEASDLRTAVSQVRRRSPRVLVIDLSMSNGSSIAAVRRLREDAPATEIVVLTMDESAAFPQQAIGAGAVGFVLKQAADAELSQAVRNASAGQRFVSGYVAVRLAAQASAPPRD